MLSRGCRRSWAGFWRRCPGLQVLATSREVLRVGGEHVFRLMPLAVQQSPPGSLAHALRSPAVQLLVERAEAAGARGFDDASSGPLTRICQQVDGIPLAIELVAARLGSQPASDLAFRLDDHMRLHSTAGRAALARQRTLAATLDWSIGLLGDAELLLFRRLSVFRAYFGVAAALSVAASALDPDVASDALLSLASKSLVVYDTDQAADSPYRLLDTTRSYAHALLVRAGEKDAVSKSHALFMLDLMGIATAELASLDADAWTQRYRGSLDDVRAALDACIGHHDDMTIAGALTVASAPLWFRLSEVSEYRDRVRAALDHVDALKVPDRLTAGRLEIALYNALWHTGGTVPEMTQACERALDCALEFQMKTLEFQARWGLCALNVTRGAYPPALQHAQILSEFASHSTNAVTRNLVAPHAGARQSLLRRVRPGQDARGSGGGRGRRDPAQPCQRVPARRAHHRHGHSRQDAVDPGREPSCHGHCHPVCRRLQALEHALSCALRSSGSVRWPYGPANGQARALESTRCCSRPVPRASPTGTTGPFATTTP